MYNRNRGPKSTRPVVGVISSESTRAAFGASLLALAAMGCGVADEPGVQEVSAPVLNGTPSTNEQPYESLLMVKVLNPFICSGILLGDAATGTGSWVLTGRTLRAQRLVRSQNHRGSGQPDGCREERLSV